VAFLLTEQPHLLRELEGLQIELTLPTEPARLAALQATSTLVEKIKADQRSDPELIKIIQKVEEGTVPDFSLTDGILRFRNRLCVANNPELKRELLQESHNSSFSSHPRSTKMYQDLRTRYWWPGIKKDIAEYVARCLTCQQVKVEHQRPGGLLQPCLYLYQNGSTLPWILWLACPEHRGTTTLFGS